MSEDVIELGPSEVSHSARRILLPSLALISLAGVIGLATAAWFFEPEDSALISGVVVFLENLVVAVVGFYTGQSLPEGRS